MDYARLLSLNKLLELNSFFLFGPRGTGKSYWIRRSLPEVKVFDLLDADVFERLLRRPRQLGEEIGSGDSWVVIDEVQKLPSILDEVHRLIETRHIRFLLTGSSARKLRRSGVNLLAGRAWEAGFFPLCAAEIPDFDLTRYLNRGGLPRAYLSASPKDELQTYARLYLSEEIKAEALARKIGNFARFLDVMALQNGKELHYHNIACDAGVPTRTIESYLQVLKDTLVGFELLPFAGGNKRKAITRSKFYFFDVGVTNALARRGEILPGSALFGECFEHWLVLEVRAFLGIHRRDEGLRYWRTKTGFEVDLVVGDALAVEFKATRQVAERHLKGLKALREEGAVKDFVVVSLDPEPRRVDGIRILPWTKFLDALWRGTLLSEHGILWQ
ncbi:MAG: ATP-binding protein [Elusimicrobia bacterium]|nr:ATP-binding protein [Elusimicrobiota bacterium]